jgi:cystathionine gamma-synthase
MVENGAKRGAGLSAATKAAQALGPGDHVVAPRAMYWVLRKWLLTFATSWGLAVDLYDNESPDQLEWLMRPGRTKLVWLETPANPTWAVTDIEAAAAIFLDGQIVV